MKKKLDAGPATISLTISPLLYFFAPRGRSVIWSQENKRPQQTFVFILFYLFFLERSTGPSRVRPGDLLNLINHERTPCWKWLMLDVMNCVKCSILIFFLYLRQDSPSRNCRAESCTCTSSITTDSPATIPSAKSFYPSVRYFLLNLFLSLNVDMF
jgi:hypothetical protein